MSSAIDYVRNSCGIAGEEVVNKLEAQAKQIEELLEQLRQLSAALAVKDEVLEHIASGELGINFCVKLAKQALSLQPHASILNKIRADAVRELYDWFMDQETFHFINEEAIETYIYQHIEKGEA